MFRSFFQTYHEFIDRRIYITLASYYFKPDDDSLSEIRLAFMKKVKREDLLTKARGVTNFKSWLGKVVRNHTISWIRARLKLHSSHQLSSDSHQVSLSTPIHGAEDITLGDTLPDPLQKDKSALGADVQKALDLIRDLEEKFQMAVSAAIMFYEPLSDEMLARIAQKRNLPLADIIREKDEIMAELGRRDAENQNKMDWAHDLWTDKQKLEGRLLELGKDSQADPEAIALLQQKINDHDNSRQKILKRHQGYIRPTSKQIAAFIGIPVEKAEGLNLILHRARKGLKRSMHLK